MMAQSTINNYDDQPVSERKSTPTSAGDSLLVRENKMRACQCTGVHKINNKRTSTETYFIHIYAHSIACRWADQTWAIAEFWFLGPRRLLVNHICEVDSQNTSD